MLKVSQIKMFVYFFGLAIFPALVDAATQFIDRGTKSGSEAHGTCPGGSQLPVIRTQAELEAIQTFLGSTTSKDLDLA